MVMRCVHGYCESDTRTLPDDSTIRFHAFPKPKTHLDRSKRWIAACGRHPSELNVDNITRQTYVCSLHFPEGRPTDSHPDPFPSEETGIIREDKKKHRSHTKTSSRGDAGVITEPSPTKQANHPPATHPPIPAPAVPTTEHPHKNSTAMDERNADDLEALLDQLDWGLPSLQEELDALAAKDDLSYAIPCGTMSVLEQTIDEQLSKLGFTDKCSNALSAVESKVRSTERACKQIDRIFDECVAKVTKMKEELEGDQGIEDPEPQKVQSGSDSDDDIQFVSKSFDPNKRQQPQQVVVRTVGPDGIPVRHLVPLHSVTGEPLPAPIVSMLTHQVGMAQKQPAAGWTVTQVPPQKLMTPQVGVKVYGRKNNDIWYKGAVVEVHSKSNNDLKFKVKFDGKGLKVLNIKHMATSEPPTRILPVGSRVIALYRDELNTQSYYAGVVAEAPSDRNTKRYLVFFDDGYAQYCFHKEIRQVFEQSTNVWEDIHPDSQDFIKSYLKQYPERPMVRLQRGQVIKTEWNGTWWTARVEEVDASLVKMFFDADRRVEWIYRGSTRLEPLFTELRNAEASKLSGKGRRHHLIKRDRKPYVEYTRHMSEEQHQHLQQLQQQQQLQMQQQQQQQQLQQQREALQAAIHAAHQPQVIQQPQIQQPQPQPQAPRTDKPRAVARKTTQPAQNSQQVRVWAKPRDTHRRSEDIQGTLKENTAMGSLRTINTIRPSRERKFYRPHNCSRECMKDVNYDPQKFVGHNPFLSPICYGFERQITRQKNNGKRAVFYRAPCTRRIRNLEEMEEYLWMTESQLTVDLFCFDVCLHITNEFVPVKTFCDIKDLSYGKETVPISCVNGIDRNYPDYVDYSNQRIPAKGVHLNLDEDFLVGCDCTDNCRDREKCACMQETINMTAAGPGGKPDEMAGYQHRLLREQLVTGIYECNPKCKCDHRCGNRVAQNALRLRLQVFKTEKRGWGLRCLDDIPAGGFICIYAGQLLTEQGANEDGQQYGDEYLAELDYIEVVERIKEGYESDVNLDEGIEEDADWNDNKGSDSDSTYSGGDKYLKRKAAANNPPSKEKEGGKGSETTPPAKLVLCRSESHNSKSDTWQVKVRDQDVPLLTKTEAWVKSLDDAIVISDEEKEAETEKAAATDVPKKEEPVNPDELPDIEPIDTLLEKKPKAEAPKKEESTDQPATDSLEGLEGLMITEPTSLNTDNVEEEDDKSDTEFEDGTKRKTRSQSRFHNLPDPKEKEQKNDEEKSEQIEYPSTRSYFTEEFCYVMDAKSMGNLGRYLNHSCSPNVFVQNVFVDTHDLRFPWVAFFAAQYIRAGQELTWDYNYEVGSVPGKVLYCYCGAAECRGRLL